MSIKVNLISYIREANKIELLRPEKPFNAVLVMCLLVGLANTGYCANPSNIENHWPPNGSLLRKTELTRQGPSVTIHAECNGIPVYGYGYSYIFGVSPDFVRSVHIQEGNDTPWKKIQPKKSWEISENFIGATPPRMPRTAASDFQPYLPIHLIDGDLETYWWSRGQNQAELEPVWIRIDLPLETPIQAVVIVPRDDNRGMPEDFCIKVSRDAWHWDMVYENHNYSLPDNTQPQIFKFEPRPVKQIWIVAKKLTHMYNSYDFSIAEVQVIDKNGDNAALVSRGSGVKVSSTDFGIMSPREMFPMLWPAHFDLGVKWVRVGYAADTLNWNWVEREKGIYEVDPETDYAVTQLVENGINVVMCLAFTNWLYTPECRRELKRAKQSWESCADPYPVAQLPSPDVPGMLEGYKNYVRFMVRHFKDRVHYFEIWNEQSGGYCWGDADPKLYSQYVRETVPIIRKESPGAKIVLGSVSGLNSSPEIGIDYLKARLDEGLGALVDVIAWHPCWSCDPAGSVYNGYPAAVKEIKAYAENHGFHGEYMATEWNYFAPYPPTDQFRTEAYSELVKAKHAARFTLMNIGLGVYPFWNETWSEHHVDRDVGLFRNTFSGDLLDPGQPQAVYYVLRTLCTVLDGVTPTELSVDFSSKEKQPFEWFAFRYADGDHLLSVCLTGESRDVSSEVRTDILISDKTFNRAAGVDVLNGAEQNLVLSQKSNSTVIPNILVKDFPLLIRISNK